MTKKIKISDLPEFNLAEHLKTDEQVALYLTSVLEENEGAELIYALGLIANMRELEEVARNADMTREELDKALCTGSQPTFECVMRILQGMGVKLVAEAANV